MTAFAAPLVARDIDSMHQCEMVTLHDGQYVNRTGQWVGITGFKDPRYVIAVPSLDRPHDIMTVPIDSEDVFVTDGAGRVIRRRPPEPDLAGDFPALE